MVIIGHCNSGRQALLITPPRAFSLHRYIIEAQNLSMDPAEMKKPLARLFLTPRTLLLLVFWVFVTSAARAFGAAIPPCTGSLNVCRFRLLVGFLRRSKMRGR